ncbi:hypothetical protein WIS52_27795 [Pseudonocardia nematodicida]|uniref:Uncharacterized protein n=1 Tax=Pseudonocardia nematodicida TaxID=1206997 RepID=A0ABV1KJC4_9PSEU
MAEQPRAAVVVPLCRAVRHHDRAGVRCPHCAAPRPGSERNPPAVVLPLLRDHHRGISDDAVVTGEL